MARRRRMLGSVNLLGLNNFGQNPGMNPIYGAIIGGGVAGTTTIVMRHTGSAHAEAFGLLAGLGASGAMYAMKSTRHAAIAGAVGAVLASGLALLERTLFGTATVPAVAVPAVAAGVKGMGIPQMRALGIPTTRALNGMGFPTAAPVAHAYGAIPGVAGAQLAAPGGGPPPVSLMGTPSAAAIHLMGIGGPPIHGLSAAYGATLLGAGR